MDVGQKLLDCLCDNQSGCSFANTTCYANYVWVSAMNNSAGAIT